MKNLNLLVIDDDAEFTSLLKLRLESWGHTVTVAVNWLAVTRQLDQKCFDAILVDVETPTGNGLTAFEFLNEDAKVASIPKVFVTGRNDAETIQRCHAMHARYVYKSSQLFADLEHYLAEIQVSEGCNTLRRTPFPNFQEEIFMIQTSKLTKHSPAHSPATAPATTSHAATLATATRPWVLCVDDDQEFSLGLKLRLQSRGYDVVRAFEGQHGYQFAFEFEPAAILLDLHLPNGNGEEILSQLVFHPETAHIPVLIVTGLNEIGLEQRMLSQGARGFFRKPVSFQDLADAVDRLAKQ